MDHLTVPTKTEMLTLMAPQNSFSALRRRKQPLTLLSFTPSISVHPAYLEGPSRATKGMGEGFQRTFSAAA